MPGLICTPFIEEMYIKRFEISDKFKSFGIVSNIVSEIEHIYINRREIGDDVAREFLNNVFDFIECVVFEMLV